MAKRINNPGIYGLFNLINGKVYIGQSIDLGERYKEHFIYNGINENHNQDISDDFKLLSVDSFIFIILEFIEFPIDFIKNIDNYRIYLKPYEDKWIDYYECLNPLYGYNKIYGGVTTLGAAFYQEANFRTKARNAKLGNTYWVNKTHKPESIEKIRVAHLRENLSKETLEKYRDKQKGNTYRRGKTQLQTTGENNPSAKLTWTQVKEIRLDYWEHNKKYFEISKEYNVTASNIAHIIKGKIWRDIEYINFINGIV